MLGLGHRYLATCNKVLSTVVTVVGPLKHHAMDALVYEDTPLATYFEGEAVPHDIPREETPPPHTPFAPRGLPNVKGRLQKIRRSATSIAPGTAYTEELLERFRYLIVASQLLSDEAGPRPSLSNNEQTGADFTTLRGAATTAVTSFVAAWIIHWLKTGEQQTRPLTWAEVGWYAVALIAIAILLVYFGRRQYTNHLQRASVRTLSTYIDDSHNLDTAANKVLQFIQEVEVVARGYELGSLLPPVSRLEDRQAVRRCQTLRRELAAALKTLTTILVECHTVMQPFVNDLDVQRYHDIYEISMVEFTHSVTNITINSEENQESLKELRFAIGLHSLARRVLLCDLLALQQSAGWSRCRQWSHTLGKLRHIQADTAAKRSGLSTTLAMEEWGHRDARRLSNDASSQSDTESVPDNHSVKAPLRRFNQLSRSIRALNAKMHLLREEINELSDAKSDNNTILAALFRNYDSIGLNLRDTLADWEQGRAAMMYSSETDHERGSCSSTSVRTPISPSPSLSALQIIDGGPADALRLLTGSPPSQMNDAFEEEVFEAVASRPPRKRMSVSVMTKEEKMAKLAEDRRKRATFQEQADNTTSMLRELQMVIKHRPRLSVSTNPATKVNSSRVATL